MPENLLAIDNGTQSIRALLFDPRGNLLAKTRVVIEPYYSTAPGLAEQDPAVFWNALCQACHELWQLPGVDKSSIAAVAVTTQRATVIDVDKNGKPLRPAIVWLDQRRAEGVKPVGGLWGAAFALAGASETVAYLQAECEYNWLAINQPEIIKKTHKHLLLSGYLTYMLTGKFVDSVGCQVAYIPFDYKALHWADRFSWRWQAIRMSRDLLPDLVPQGKPLGTITPQAAQATGIPAGLTLIAAAADKACEVLGSGSLEPHVACLSYGTTATINTTHRKYIEIIPLLPPYPAAEPGLYNLELQIYRGFWMVSWFKKEFGLREENLAYQRGVQPEEIFDEIISEIPPGSHGLVLQPYWSPGLRHPGPEARGAIIGFNDVHTRAHLYRAILEGLTYALREGKERTEKRSGHAITELRVAGGGSQSDVAMQITANIFGQPAARPHLYEASGLGAAMIAAVGAGVHPDFETALQEMTRLERVFEPEPHAQRVYDELYNQVYRKMFKSLRPFYQVMWKLTPHA